MAKRSGGNLKPVDPYPKVDQNSSAKKVLRISATTVMRRREPTAEPQIASKFPNMVWDYSQQRAVWPNGKPNVLIEASQATGRNYDTINKSGHPFALGDMMMGGSPEDTGQPIWPRPKQKKMLK